jgi:hypothetical protein
MSFFSRVQALDTTGSRLAVFCFSLMFFYAIWELSTRHRFLPDPAPPLFNDYLQEFVGGYIVLKGDSGRLYDPAYADQIEHDPEITGFSWQPGGFLPMIYPPFYYLLLSPLSMLSLRTAVAIWLGMMGAAWVGTLLLLDRALPWRAVLIWASPVGLLFAPMMENLAGGQKGTLMLLILTATYLLLDRGRPFSAGLVFGLLTFKPHLTLVIGVAFLLKRQWRFVAGSIVTTLVFVGLCLLMGLDVCRQYVQFIGTLSGYIDANPVPRYHCWYGFFRLLMPNPQPLEHVQVLTLLANGLTLAALIPLLRGPLRFGQPAFALQFGGLIIATILVSPHLLTYDLTLLLLPLFLLVRLLPGQGETPGEQSPVLALLALALYVYAGFSSGIAAEYHIQGSVLLMFALLLAMAWHVYKSESPPAISDGALLQ